MVPSLAIVSTSKLIGHSLVQRWQWLQRSGFVSRCKAGHWIQFRIFIPRTINGAIQQMEWQKERLPIPRAGMKIKAITE